MLVECAGLHHLFVGMISAHINSARPKRWRAGAFKQGCIISLAPSTDCACHCVVVSGENSPCSKYGLPSNTTALITSVRGSIAGLFSLRRMDSLCSNYRLPSNVTALITSVCG